MLLEYKDMKLTYHNITHLHALFQRADLAQSTGLNSKWEAAAHGTGSPAWCSVITDGWSGGVAGRYKREGIHLHIQLTHFIVQQKLAQQCKAIIPQPKKCRKQTGAHPWTTAWLAWSYVMSRYKSLASGKDWLAQRTDSLSRELAVKVPEWVVGRI